MWRYARQACFYYAHQRNERGSIPELFSIVFQCCCGFYSHYFYVMICSERLLRFIYFLPSDYLLSRFVGAFVLQPLFFMPAHYRY